MKYFYYLILGLQLLAGSAFTQQYGWRFDGVFPDSTFRKGGGCAGLAVDPTGSVWIQTKNPSDSIPGGAVYYPIYCYAADGTPKQFSPLRVITVNNRVDTLWQANGGIINGPNGNIIFTSGPHFYRMNYVTLAGMNEIQPTTGFKLRAPAVDKDAGFYTGHTNGGLPIKEYDENISYLRDAVASINSEGSTMEVSWDGLNLFIPGQNRKNCAWFKRPAKGGPFTLYDSIFNGAVISSMRYERNRGILWFDAGSAADLTPSAGFAPNTWYGWDLTAKRIVESISWKFTSPGFTDEKPGAIAFSWTGDTAYIGCNGSNAYSPIQRFVRYMKNQVYSIPRAVDFGSVETGTVGGSMVLIIKNYKNTILIIQRLQLNLPFKLAEQPNYPVSVNPFDSLTLKLSFAPSAEGTAVDTFRLISNDSTFQGTVLSGTGYNIQRAAPRIMYGVCGSANNGAVIKLDRSTGAGSLIGQSSFSDLKSAAIHPATSVIYGLISGSNSSTLLKIQAGSGKAYQLFPLTQMNLAGIAFDTAGTLVAASKSGAFYKINLADGQ